MNAHQFGAFQFVQNPGVVFAQMADTEHPNFRFLWHPNLFRYFDNSNGKGNTEGFPIGQVTSTSDSVAFHDSKMHGFVYAS